MIESNYKIFSYRSVDTESGPEMRVVCYDGPAYCAFDMFHQNEYHNNNVCCFILDLDENELITKITTTYSNKLVVFLTVGNNVIIYVSNGNNMALRHVVNLDVSISKLYITKANNLVLIDIENKLYIWQIADFSVNLLNIDYDTIRMMI